MSISRRGLRYFYFAWGWLFVLLGFTGALLPLLPTTPFLLVAIACFSRSSERFEQWLLEHPRFGPPLLLWRQHGVIPPRAKFYAVLALLLSAAILLSKASIPIYGKAFGITALIASGTFILTRKSHPN